MTAAGQPVIEDQDVAERAALVCHRVTRTGITVEATYWDTTRQARQAEIELTPCGPLCSGLHTVARVPDPTSQRSRTRTTSPAGGGKP